MDALRCLSKITEDGRVLTEHVGENSISLFIPTQVDARFSDRFYTTDRLQGQGTGSIIPDLDLNYPEGTSIIKFQDSKKVGLGIKARKRDGDLVAMPQRVIISGCNRPVPRICGGLHSPMINLGCDVGGEHRMLQSFCAYLV